MFLNKTQSSANNATSNVALGKKSGKFSDLQTMGTKGL